MKDEKRTSTGRRRPAPADPCRTAYPGVAARRTECGQPRRPLGRDQPGHACQQGARQGRARGTEGRRRPGRCAPRRRPVAAPPPSSTADALREAKGLPREARHFEAADPTTHALRGAGAAPKSVAPATGDFKTQAVRGKPKVTRTAFHADPVVGWLVVVGGPGLGAYRPIYEGNNAIGRGKDQRIPIDFGDPSISSEAQAYIRYDSMDRSFLFVPNLSKTNIVAINDEKPTGAVKLELMDVITMGRTQLAFVPFCGDNFDWSELSDLKE